MAPLRQRIIETLPSLRRYACALTGDGRAGDEYIRVALTVLLEEPRHLQADADLKFQLYKLFHRVLEALSVPEADAYEDDAECDPYFDVKRGLMALPLLNRKLLLLVMLERFSLDRAAELLDLSVHEARLRLARARRQLTHADSRHGAVERDALFGQRAA